MPRRRNFPGKDCRSVSSQIVLLARDDPAIGHATYKPSWPIVSIPCDTVVPFQAQCVIERLTPLLLTRKTGDCAVSKSAELFLLAEQVPLDGRG